MKNKTLPLFLFIYSFILIVSCASIQEKTNKTTKTGDTYWKQENSINFLVVGDWGRYGEFHQKDVAHQMGLEAAKIHTSFVLSMGDNFYPDGVISTIDPQWNKSFENIYTNYSLNIPWFTAFGNHDYRGSIQAQLDYSKVSRRWRTTERYYSFEKTIPNSSEKALFVFIDSNPFDETLSRKSHSDLASQDKEAQLEWLEKTLATSTARWKIVIGHHPLYTTGVRRDKMLDVRKVFLPIFEKHKVNAYLAGHEHDLQHQKPEGFTHYFVSGAGSEIRPVTQDEQQTKFAISDHGFMSMKLHKDQLNVQVINFEGKQLYQTTISR
jgi:tartrate-resistant acid phosphatase type 5